MEMEQWVQSFNWTTIHTIVNMDPMDPMEIDPMEWNRMTDVS